MKTLRVGLLCTTLALGSIYAATDSPENQESASELADQQAGSNPFQTQPDEDASSLADETLGSMKVNPGESASELAADRDLNPGTTDTEESASELADERLGPIPAGQNQESARQLADERDGIASPTPSPNGSPATSVGAGTGINGTVYAAAVQDDGKIIVVGQFSQVDSQTRTNIARLNADGSLDATFLPKATDGLNGPAYAVAIDGQGGILVGGSFSEAQITTISNFVRYQPEGTLDKGFSEKTRVNGRVLAVAVQPDGKIVIGGEFSEVGSDQRRNIARINPDGSLADSVTSAGTMTGTVRSLAVLSNGQILAGGTFEVPGQTRKNVLIVPGE